MQNVSNLSHHLTTLAQRNRQRQTLLAYLLITPPFLIMLFLIVYPALLSVVGTLQPTVNGARQFGLGNYLDFFKNPISVANLLFTLWSTAAVILGLFIICLPIALYLRFSKSPLAAWVQALSLFPLFVPGIILAYAFIRFLGPNGLLETLLEVTTGWQGYHTPYFKPSGAIIGLIWEGIPLTVLVLTAGLSQIPDALLEAAKDVGANNLRIFMQIILPLIQRSLLITFSLNFLGVIGAFTLPYLLGPAAPEMMGVYMQRTFYAARSPDEAETQAVLTFLLGSIVGFLYVRAAVQQRKQESSS
jgi:putative spermidine/putrescine transport system permease protein